MMKPSNLSKNTVCKLANAINRLKQLNCCWNTVLFAHLETMNIKQLQPDLCIYTSIATRDIFYIGVYVDDMVQAWRWRRSNGRSEAKTKRASLLERLGKLTFYWCISCSESRGIKYMKVTTCVRKVLMIQKMSDSNPVGTLICPEILFEGYRRWKGCETMAVSISCKELHVFFSLHEAKFFFFPWATLIDSLLRKNKNSGQQPSVS